MPCLGTTINDLDVKLIKKEFLPKAVAEAMKVLGYVNRFSRGIYRVQKELGENRYKNNPEN